MMYYSRLWEMLEVSHLYNRKRKFKRNKTTLAVLRYYKRLSHDAYFDLYWIASTTYLMEDF